MPPWVELNLELSLLSKLKGKIYLAPKPTQVVSALIQFTPCGSHKGIEYSHLEHSRPLEHPETSSQKGTGSKPPLLLCGPWVENQRKGEQAL